MITPSRPRPTTPCRHWCSHLSTCNRWSVLPPHWFTDSGMLPELSLATLGRWSGSGVCWLVVMQVRVWRKQDRNKVLRALRNVVNRKWFMAWILCGRDGVHIYTWQYWMPYILHDITCNYSSAVAQYWVPYGTWHCMAADICSIIFVLSSMLMQNYSKTYIYIYT